MRKTIFNFDFSIFNEFALNEFKRDRKNRTLKIGSDNSTNPLNSTNPIHPSNQEVYVCLSGSGNEKVFCRKIGIAGQMNPKAP